MYGVAQLTFCDKAQPLMLLAQHEGATSFAQAFVITTEQSVADIFSFEGKTSDVDSEMSTNGETHQIDGVGHRPRFVKVIHSPDEPAFDITPGAEVLDMKITHGENMRRPGEIRTDLRPELRPPVVGGAKERKDLRLHAGVLKTKVFLIDMSALGQPLFEIACGFDDVHAGNDSDGEKKKSNERKDFIR